MQLTKFTDYALRVLMFANAAGDRLVTIEEMSLSYGVSRDHLMKVVSALTKTGFLTAVRGRSGGVKLARGAENIRLGDVVRQTEPDFALVECLGTHNTCLIAKCCRLPKVLLDAKEAFLSTLDAHTLADISVQRSAFHGALDQRI